MGDEATELLTKWSKTADAKTPGSIEEETMEFRVFVVATLHNIDENLRLIRDIMADRMSDR